jgi:hypothetical protein
MTANSEVVNVNVVEAAIDVLDANCNCPFASDILRLMALTAERLEERWATNGWPSSGLPVASKCSPSEIQSARDKWVLNHPLMIVLKARLDWISADRPTGGPTPDDDALRWANLKAAPRSEQDYYDWSYGDA